MNRRLELISGHLCTVKPVACLASRYVSQQFGEACPLPCIVPRPYGSETASAVTGESSLWCLSVRSFGVVPERFRLHVLLSCTCSQTMESGALAEWTKEEGEEVGPGDVLAIIKTDKTNVDFEMQDEGFLAKKLVPEGDDDIALGAPVAVIVEDEEDIAAFAEFTAADAGDAGGAPAEAPSPAPAPAPAPAPSPAPSPAPAPAPTPAPAPAPAAAPTPAPAPAPAPASSGSPSSTASSSALAGAGEFASVPFDGFGTASRAGPLGSLLGQAQGAYSDAFGDTGFEEVQLEEKSKEDRQ